MKRGSYMLRNKFIILFVILFIFSCNTKKSKKTANINVGGKMSIQIICAAFKEGETIPVKYTCDGENVSPALNWSGAPEGTKSFALICDDPDAPGRTWIHWVVYNIPATMTSLPEAVPMKKTVLNNIIQGTTSFRKIGYGGPCPPRGPAHRYFFKIYALDTELNLKAGASENELLKAMEGHILAKGQLMGRYSR